MCIQSIPLCRSVWDAGMSDKKFLVPLLFHTPVSLETSYTDLRSQQLSTYFRPCTDFSVAKEAGVGLQLSGHTHAGQMFAFNLLSKRFFRGYHRGLHTFGDFSIYISVTFGE